MIQAMISETTIPLHEKHAYSLKIIVTVTINVVQKRIIRGKQLLVLLTLV